MISDIKRALYFPLASYFRFFAKIKLNRWKPRVIVITGSSGKTTIMALIESQLGENAYYSHHANSAFGVPFNILGLSRTTLMKSEWISLLLLAPFKAFSSYPTKRIYVVEADCDRPFEGEFLSEFLNPEIVIWLSSSRTHSMNFDPLVSMGKFESVEKAIAYEYGHFLAKASKLTITNGDSKLIKDELTRSKAEKIEVSASSLADYKVSREGTIFKSKDNTYTLNFLLPKAVFYSIQATKLLLAYLEMSFDSSFQNLKIPPGRSSIFKGIKNTTLIDSSYNTGLSAMLEIINMFMDIKADEKWIVIGDILEQGRQEKEEHEKLGKELTNISVEKIILLGPRVLKYTKPILEAAGFKDVVVFENPKEVLNYITSNLSGGETILFKGARFLEGVIEYLLENKDDVQKLARREKIWQERRKDWGL